MLSIDEYELRTRNVLIQTNPILEANQHELFYLLVEVAAVAFGRCDWFDEIMLLVLIWGSLSFFAIATPAAVVNSNDPNGFWMELTAAVGFLYKAGFVFKSDHLAISDDDLTLYGFCCALCPLYGLTYLLVGISLPNGFWTFLSNV